MTTVRRIVIVAALAAMAAGLASAGSVEDFITSYPASGTQLADFNYTLTLPDFNVPGATLNSVTLYLYANASVQTLTVTNEDLIEQDGFEATYSMNVSQSQANTLVAADHYGNETLAIFDSGIISMAGGFLGPEPCPEGTPNATCNVVAYTPPAITDSNTTGGCCGTVGTGAGGVTGIVLDSSDPNAYIGPTSFSITGNTHQADAFNGGAGHIVVTSITNTYLELEVDYDYTLPGGAPEPGTLALMGGALLGLGLLGNRLKKN